MLVASLAADIVCLLYYIVPLFLYSTKVLSEMCHEIFFCNFHTHFVWLSCVFLVDRGHKLITKPQANQLAGNQVGARPTCRLADYYCWIKDWSIWNWEYCGISLIFWSWYPIKVWKWMGQGGWTHQYCITLCQHKQQDKKDSVSIQSWLVTG